MFAGQGEFRSIMIVRSWFPRGRRMALRTGLGEAGCLVIRIRHADVIDPVAIDAVRAEPRVLVVRVTVFARHSPVRPCQRESCRRVVKRRGCPGCCGVARLTGHRELCGSMVGILGRLVDRLMARIALQRCIPEDTVLMTRDAGNGPVTSRQRKCGPCVIEA